MSLKMDLQIQTYNIKSNRYPKNPYFADVPYTVIGRQTTLL